MRIAQGEALPAGRPEGKASMAIKIGNGGDNILNGTNGSDLLLGAGGQSFALGDFHKSPLPTLFVSVAPPAVWDAVGMRGTLWMARVAINLHHAFDADFYWVGFFSCFVLLRAARYAGQALPQSRCGRGAKRKPSEARSAKEGYFRTRPGTKRTLRGPAIQIASADTAQSTVASTKASR